MDIRAIMEFRLARERELKALGVPIPPWQPYDDAVTYNDTLLAAVEVAREAEVKKKRGHAAYMRDYRANQTNSGEKK